MKNIPAGNFARLPSSPALRKNIFRARHFKSAPFQNVSFSERVMAARLKPGFFPDQFASGKKRFCPRPRTGKAE
ncbi:hypothetical protein LJC36_02055 [Desulfovibrio sp. OttesenSCG-928-C14]|nr:hypothetical protein [Desulfovibrio sp. OttesenSCG-928-C14]